MSAADVRARDAAMGYPASLARLVSGTTQALARCVREDGVLLDAAAGVPTPPDHYGTTFAALALAVANPADARWRALLARWRPVRPAARGHAPFNRLALLLLTEHLGRRPASGAVPACGRLWRHPSNNWLLLARACDVLEGAWAAPRAPLAGRLGVAGARFDAACARWLTPSRGFVDYPARLRGAPVAAPLCYHAKCSAVLALVCQASPTPLRERWLAETTRWLVEFVDERSGHFGGYGRSSHSLFGVACALFVSLDALARTPSADERSGHAQRIDALCAGLEAGRRDDGLLSLTPSREVGRRGGWDDYMHLSVYNAWAAGLLGWLWARLTDGRPGGRSAAGTDVPAATAPGLFVDSVAGVAACRGLRASAFVSLHGGVVQDFGAEDVDLRSAGLQPFHLSCGGRAQIAPPLRVAKSVLLRSPCLAGFTPIFRVGDALYGLVHFPVVEVHGDPRGRLLAFGWGTPLRLHDDATRALGVRRLVDALDTRLLASRLRRRRAVAPPPLPGHLALRAFAFDGETGRLAVATWLRGCISPAIWLNPLGHTWLGCASRSPTRRALRAGESEAMAGIERLPAALPDAFAASGAAQGWPAQDTLWMLDLDAGSPDASSRAPEAAPLLRVDVERGLLVTPWRQQALTPPRP